MNLRHSFHPLAQLELDEAAEAYELSGSGVGLHFLEAVEAAIQQVRRFPESARVVKDPVRAKVVYGYPYTVYYYVKLKEVRVLAIAHQRRQPCYWTERLAEETLH